MKNLLLLVFAVVILILFTEVSLAGATENEDDIMELIQPVSIITDEIGRNPHTGDILIELNLEALPNGTASLQLRSGDMIRLDGLSGIVLMEMSPHQLKNKGELSFTALDSDGEVLASYTLQIADRLPDMPMSTVGLVFLIAAILAAIGAVTAVVMIRRKSLKAKLNG